MTDKELLELAAKAAGILQFQTTSPFRSDIPYFDPLTDDGDALRLAVKLGLRILCFGDWVSAGGDKDTNGKIEQCGSDQYAATRRVIVRAAAAIGENK